MFITVIISLITTLAPAAGEKNKLVYEPLSAEARVLKRLDKYASIKKQETTVTLGGLTLRAKVPISGEAYDTVPIEYTLEGKPEGDERVAVEAVAFENEARRKGRDLYDLALPGNMKLKIEYLGSRTGVFDPSRVSRLGPDSRHEQFPPYRLGPLVRSGRIERGNYLFFKIKVTNVGDTILDPEGFGGWMSIPQMFQVAANGERKLYAQTINRFGRHLKYVYPGESFEEWVSFHHPDASQVHNNTLPPGRYVLRYNTACRWNRDWDWGTNMWGGRVWMALDVPFEVAERGEDAPVAPQEVIIDKEPDRLCRYVRSFEEFMTSFKVYEQDELKNPASGTLYLQVAPWTDRVVLKLIGNAPGRIKTAAVPIRVSSGNLRVRYNPDNPFTISRNGRSVPMIGTQIMPAMRTSAQIGPEPEKHLRERLREAMDAGVNVISTTAGDWAVPQVCDPKAFVGDMQAETWKYYYDVIAPEAGIPVFGWGEFPPRTPQARCLGEAFWGKPSAVSMLTTDAQYNYSHRPEMDIAHPDFPMVYAGTILFNAKRWGHLWPHLANGDVLIDIEDTWGWLRDDINVRYYMGEHALRRFRQWLGRKYRNVDAVNKVWGTTFKSIDEIDPQKDQSDGGTVFNTPLAHCKPEYMNPKLTFHDWSPAIDDWDLFRTDLRCDIYNEIQRIVRKTIPKAKLALRTEGAVVPVTIPGDSDDAHLRHIHYVQRRNALVSEVLQKRKVLRYHSDYTTMPYTESEWRLLLAELRKEGIRGFYLPQFCTARDMVLNDWYGRDYTVQYNLSTPKKAVMMHVLQAAFPVWRIMYEEGHCPGVLWEDYECDGFVSETQLRELKLFRQELDTMPRSR